VRDDPEQHFAHPEEVLPAFQAGRDRIAFQYAHDFEDVFALGVPRLRQALCGGIPGGISEEWAVAHVYLGFLSRFRFTNELEPNPSRDSESDKHIGAPRFGEARHEKSFIELV